MAVVAFVAISLVTAAAVAIVPAPQAATQSCAQPAYLVRLADEVELSQKFVSQEHGLTYVLVSGDNQSATTGQIDGRPYYSPPATQLEFLSYADGPAGDCQLGRGTRGVVGALWVQVPLFSNGTYDIDNASTYFTPGVFPNGTSAAS